MIVFAHVPVIFALLAGHLSPASPTRGAQDAFPGKECERADPQSLVLLRDLPAFRESCPIYGSGEPAPGLSERNLQTASQKPTRLQVHLKDNGVALGVDPERLTDAVRYLEKHAGPDGVKRMVIVRRGRILWSGIQADRRQPVASVTKAFTSTAHGLLIEDGKCTLDTLARDYNPEHLAERYPLVTLRHLATMTSGYDGVGGTYDCDEAGKRCDANAFVPPATPVFPPGTRFMYWDEATQEYGYVLTKIAGEPLPDLLKRRILDPIGVSSVAWNQDATGKFLNLTGGLEISAADLARFGHLYLNRGVWDGKPLIDPAWVDEATHVQVPASLPSGHSGTDHREGSGVYGYHWWPNGIKPDGARKWPGAPAGMYARSGYKNNHCFVIPEWSMVIVWLGLDHTHTITDPEWNEFLKQVGRSIERGDP